MNGYGLKTFYGELNILDIGSWVPDDIIHSSCIQSEIDMYPSIGGRDFLKKTGVSTRRAASEEVTVLDMAESATLDALARLKRIPDFSVNCIDTIIYSSVTRMYTEPATAALLQKRLGIASAVSFDVTNACLSFIDGLIIADSLIKSGISKCALVVSAEKVSPVLENSRRAINETGEGREYLASLTLGDGAAAAVICGEEYKEHARLRLKAYSRTTVSEYAECCILPSHDHPMATDSSALFNGAINHFPEMFTKLMSDIGWELPDISVMVPHQASIKVIQQGMKAINFPMDRCAITLDTFGNMASVSIPFTLKSAIERSDLGSGDRIGILGFGSGLSFSMMAMEVNCPDETGGIDDLNTHGNRKVDE